MREINWTTLISGIVAAGKLVSSSFGITIPDELINDLVNGVAAVIAVAAIFMSHKKGATPTKVETISGNTPPTTKLPYDENSFR